MEDAEEQANAAESMASNVQPPPGVWFDPYSDKLEAYSLLSEEQVSQSESSGGIRCFTVGFIQMDSTAARQMQPAEITDMETRDFRGL